MGIVGSIGHQIEANGVSEKVFQVQAIRKKGRSTHTQGQ
jgi:hypothetical protein